MLASVCFGKLVKFNLWYPVQYFKKLMYESPILACQKPLSLAFSAWHVEVVKLHVYTRL